MAISAITVDDPDQQAHRELFAHYTHAPSGPAYDRLVDAGERVLHLEAYDRLIKDGTALSLDEALQGMVYVISASNLRVRDKLAPFIRAAYAKSEASSNSPHNHEALVGRAIAFLQGMAVRESLSGLVPEEIAGLAIGGLADCVIHVSLGEVIETCGMGGDRGVGRKRYADKTINASTLSAIVLASLGRPTVKHGSRATTAALGSTDAMHLLGLPTNYDTPDALRGYFKRHNFVYLNSRLKTLHDLSTLTKLETVNHLIGPMSPPLSHDTRIHKVIGVNSKVDPSTVVQAYNLLHDQGMQEMGGIIAVCGLAAGTDPAADLDGLHKAAVLDELGPETSLLAVGQGGDYYGAFTLHLPTLLQRSALEITFPNEPTLVEQKNADALSGRDPDMSLYLAANAALGLMAAGGMTRQLVTDPGHRSSLFTAALAQATEVIHSGGTQAYLDRLRADL